MNIELGQRYKDRVSGWEGIAVARYEFLNGCVRFEIAGADKDGKPTEYVIDEQQLEPTDGPVFVPLDAGPKGGSRSNQPVARH